MCVDTILGIGTARSGTMSLAKLLQAQGLDIGHERSTSVDWQLEKQTRFGRLQRELDQWDGEVACWLTQAAPRLMEQTGAKTIAMLRPKADTVDSLINHMAGIRIRSDRPFGPMIFPSYTDRDLKAAWEAYWDDYVRMVGRLVSAYPNRVLCVRTYELETETEQERIADFLGIDDWHYVNDCHHNKRASGAPA